MIAGPLLVSAVLVVSGPATAVALAGAVIAVGGVGFALTPAACGWRSTRPSRSSGHRSGGLRPGLRTLLVGNSALGFAAGATSVALPAAVLAQGRPGLAGVGFAAMAVGDVIGGLVYGTVRWRVTRPVQLCGSLVVAAVVGWGVVATAASLPALFALLAMSGVLGACVPICMSALLDDLAPRGSLTTHYTFMVGAGLIAGSAGNALSGALAQHYGAAAAFALDAAVVSGAGIWITARRRTLVR